jgi:DNA (cytosine-5)-methyltransferase 1
MWTHQIKVYDVQPEHLFTMYGGEKMKLETEAKHLKNKLPKPEIELGPKITAVGKNGEKRLKFIDLFSGIGGFRIALESSGAECVFSSDIDKWANETYFENFGEWPNGDIKKIKSEDVPDFDILCAGFPCQSFSIGGKRKGFKDTRGTLFFDVARILKKKRPSAFILENVKGLTSHDGGETVRIIRNTLRGLDYTIFENVMNAKNYGLPQNRERWFCVGFRNDFGIKDFSFPKKEALGKKVGGLLDTGVRGYEPTPTAWKHIKKHYAIFKSKKGMDRPDFPENGNPTLANQIRPSKCTMNNSGITPCLTAKMGTGGNNIPVIVDLKRKLTEKECLRLMGFPEWFKIKKGSYQSYKQIGNSVPVKVLSKIAHKVVKTLEEYEKKRNDSRVEECNFF